MWALLSQWMSGLVAMTPFGCTTLLVLLKPSQQGLRPGAARVPHDADSSHGTFDLIVTSESSRGTVVRGLNPHPVWAQDIFELLRVEGRPDEGEDEPSRVHYIVLHRPCCPSSS